MSYTAIVKSPFAEMHACFQKEKLCDKRCKVSMRKEKDNLYFEIVAKDSVSLRATLNAITKLFTVYEKAKAL